MIDIDRAPLGGHMTVGAFRTGLGVIGGLATRHRPVVALCTSRWNTFEDCSGMTSFAGDNGVRTFKRKVGCAMIKITINFEAAIDLFCERQTGDTKNHREPNRDEFHRGKR